MELRLEADEFDRLGTGTHRVELPGGRRVFVKSRADMPADFFQAEARGLVALSASPLRVPNVYAVWDRGIALEDLGNGCADTQAWARAGANLARLHAIAGQHFGFAQRGWCGDSEQDNTPETDGFRFFAERRLLSQARRAFNTGRLQASEVAQLESIGARLSQMLPPRPPRLVHGDLWLGNLHVCADGEIAMIDGGAVHYGWAESDLAMTTLFGAPPAAFFSEYESVAVIGSDWRERASLLNLYHLLNHLNLFGSGYLNAVRAVLRRYA